MTVATDTGTLAPMGPNSPPKFHRWTHLTFRLLSGLSLGRLTVVLPDGYTARFEGPDAGPEATVIVRDERVIGRCLFGGDIAFAEAYMDGLLDSPDLPAVIELLVRNKAAIEKKQPVRPWKILARRILHWINANTRRGSRRNIAFHYDLGNAFYEQWLDPTMTYSAARFEGGQQGLDAAQIAKYRRIAERLRLEPGKRVLEIGCGWGGFAELAAREYGARVHGITLSEEQLAYAVERARRGGFADKASFALCDYRDADGRYDGIASIEMFEAVGESYWPAFFTTLRDRLVAGGRAAVQVITIAEESFEDYRRNPDFIQRYIFPGGMLPSREGFIDLARRTGLQIDDEEAFGLDYALTLAKWRRRFLAAWPGIEPLGFDERFRRMWDYYLAYCEGGFRSRNVDVRQFALLRP